jgi:hypothetical protein
VARSGTGAIRLTGGAGFDARTRSNTPDALDRARGRAYDSRMRSRRLPLLFLLGATIVAAACQLGGSDDSAATGTIVPVPPGARGSTCVGQGAACADSAAVASYGLCVFVECQSAYAACFGAGFAGGTYTGDCADFATCVDACSACDADCVAACQSQHESSACSSCLGQQVVPCLDAAIANAKCSAPCRADAGADAAASDGSCEALATCCSRVPSVDSSTCAAAYLSAAGDSARCAEARAVYVTQGKCL